MNLETLFVNSLYLAGIVLAIGFSATIISIVTAVIKKQKQRDKIDIENYKIIADKHVMKILKNIEKEEL